MKKYDDIKTKIKLKKDKREKIWFFEMNARNEIPHQNWKIVFFPVIKDLNWFVNIKYEYW
jgi:hypothetical protein